MVMITMENVTERLRGECTRFLLEVKTGVFLGTINATVRELLWKKITESGEAGGAVLAYSSQTEQGFSLVMHGDPKKKVKDIDGIFLIETQ